MKIKYNLEYLFLFIIVFVENSFWLRTQYNAKLRYILILLMSIIFILSKVKKNSTIIINKMKLLLFIIIVLTISVSSVFHNEINEGYFSYVLSISMAFIISNSIKFRDLKKIYTNIMFVICIYSFLTIIISYIIPEVIYKFPQLNNSYAGHGNEYFMGLNVINMSSQYRRNKGCFFEHGMFSIYISMAAILELSNAKNLSIKKMWVYIITLLSTMSTIGWIIAGCLIIILLLSNEEYSKNKKYKASIILFIILLLIIYPYLPKGFDKLFVKFTEGNKSGTLAERISSLEIALKGFLHNPFIGSSRSYISYLNSLTISKIMTITWMNWFAYYGFILGSICNLAIVLFIKKINNTNIIKIISFIILISGLSTQNMMESIILNLLIFYSLDREIFKRGEINESSTTKYIKQW